MESCAIESNNTDHISRVFEPKILSKSTLWWKGPQWLSQEKSSWLTTEINTPTDKLEIINVHIACLNTPENITHIFSKMRRHIRVTAYCKRFISNCRNSKANRKSTILCTHDFDQALTSCVMMVKQISYVQKMKNEMENKRLQPAFISRHCFPS